VNCRWQQIPHAHEVVSGGRKREHPSNFEDAPVPCLAHYCIQPAKNFLNPLPFPPTDLVAGMSCRPPVDRRTARSLVGLKDTPRSTWPVGKRRNQRPIQAEVLIGEQVGGAGLAQHLGEELLGNLTVHQPVAVLATHRGHPYRLIGFWAGLTEAQVDAVEASKLDSVRFSVTYNIRLRSRSLTCVK
jgi:hypothetical protein